MLGGLQKSLFARLPGVIQGELARRCPIGVDAFSVDLSSGERLHFDQMEKSRLIRKLFWRGIQGHEPATMRVFDTLARNAETVFDIGAFFGLYGLVAAKVNLEAQVHCFEPVPENVSLMNHFIALNQTSNVHSHHLAISDQTGVVKFFIPRAKDQRLPDIGSVCNRFESGRFADRDFDTIEVSALTLDQFCDIHGIATVDLMKIDVEESELQVLSSGRRLLERSRPDIICEVIFDHQQNQKIEELLSPLGYRCFVMSEQGLHYTDRLDSYVKDGRQQSKGGYSDRLLTTRNDSELEQLFSLTPVNALRIAG